MNHDHESALLGKVCFPCRRCSRRKCTQTLSYWLLTEKRVWFSPILLFVGQIFEQICRKHDLQWEPGGLSWVMRSFPNSCATTVRSQSQKKPQPDGRRKCPVSELVPSQRTLWFLTAASNACIDKLLQSCSFVTSILLWEHAASTSIRLH